VKVVAPTPEGLREAAAVIADGGIVAYPTETVYGLAVNPFSQVAVQRLIEIKGRKAESSILLVIGNEEQLDQVVSEVSPMARHFMAAFWPGPLTLLFPKSARLAPGLLGSGAKIAVRCPGLASARDLCLTSDMPLTSTSANRSGQPPALRVEDINLPEVALAIDGGALALSLPSTLYDPDTGEILREGEISRSALEAVRAGFTG
jgi:L-threonylcarbamoyladenylate synthase